MEKHGFKVAFKSGQKVKEVNKKLKTPLGERRKELVYEIVCKCGKCVYVGQTEQTWGERRDQHMDNIRYGRSELEGGTESGQRKFQIK